MAGLGTGPLLKHVANKGRALEYAPLDWEHTNRPNAENSHEDGPWKKNNDKTEPRLQEGPDDMTDGAPWLDQRDLQEEPASKRGSIACRQQDC